MADVGQVLSAEEMLARAAKNVASGKTTANQSAVQKLLAQRDTPIEDTVELSGVQKLLQAREAQDAERAVPYTEQDWFLELKVNQLRAQLAIYSAVPGLDSNGAVLSGIEAEIKDIIEKQQAKLQESLSKADDAQAALEEQDRLRAAELFTPEQLLDRLNGNGQKTELSAEAKALLDKVKSVNTTA
ncbi:MAG: hypothetical protein H6869_09075 [Rhodospirillales bacterium]|nr:hypothetical protein [Rhodospirillales bacterium]